MLKNRVLLDKPTVDLVAKVASVGQLSHVWLKQLQKAGPFRLSCNLDSLLDDVVSILVSEVIFERSSLHHLINHSAADVGTRTLQALFDHV